MKLRAFDKKVFTVDVWSYTDTPSGNDVIRTFSYSETINVNITTDNTTRLIISSDAPITKSYQIRNVKDRTNASVMAGYYWVVNTNEPIINAFGIVEGYKVKTAAGVQI